MPQTDRQFYPVADDIFILINRWTVLWLDRQTDRQIYGQIDKRIDRQEYRQIEEQKDR